jgi:F5/8 type C domain/FecR protein
VVSTLRVTVALVAAAALLTPVSARAESQQSGHATRSQLGKVWYIYHGLSVQPPHAARVRGAAKMPLYAAYGLRTARAQRASIQFNDKTTLHINERTDAVLKSPSLTYVGSGEVDEVLVPGTNHRIQTDSALATAIGTNYLVKALGKRGSIFIVVRGAVRVKNNKGSVTVRKNQESIVLANQAPQPPIHVDAQKAAAWTQSMPSPNLPENIALDSNGGTVVDFSSQYTSSTQGAFWNAIYINDGRLDYGWASDSGQISNQWVKLSFAGNKTYRVIGVLINPAATHGDPKAADLKDFEIRVSTTGTADSDFATVFTGACDQRSALQSFQFSSPVQAKYLELFAVDNHGSPDWVTVAELEVLATAA